MKQNISPSTTATLLLTAGLISLLAYQTSAQSYTLVDLTPNAASGVATDISSGTVAGSSAAGIFSPASHAQLWDGLVAADLHPAFLDDAANKIVGRSAILGGSANLQVGWGAGATTGSRLAPMLWRGSAASATTLAIPFVNAGGQATATDGSQIVGYGTALNRDGTAFGPSRGIVWDAATGAATDLGDGGNGAQVYGVGGGQQVGYVIKSLATAALWKSSSKSLVTMQPNGAVMSVANATDGQRQVGYAGYDIRVRVEAAKGNKDARFYYATVWTGTAASAINIHPYPVNSLPGVTLSHSYALNLNGQWTVGYGGDQSKFGTPAYSHALVWDANYQAVDLNAFLPEGFVGAQALSVDANGDVSGFMSKADGTRHAVVWILNPAQ